MNNREIPNFNVEASNQERRLVILRAKLEDLQGRTTEESPETMRQEIIDIEKEIEQLVTSGQE